MKPIIALLIGALLIGSGIITANRIGQGIGIVLSIAGVVTVIVGMAMLFNLAHLNE